MKRWRGFVEIDVFVPESVDPAIEQRMAQETIEKVLKDIPNSYLIEIKSREEILNEEKEVDNG